MFIPSSYKLIGFAIIVAISFFYGLKIGTDRSDVVIDGYVNQVNSLKNDLDKEQHNIKEKIVVEYKDRIRVVKEKEIVYRDLAINTVPSQFNLSNGWIYLHDQSALGLDADRILSSDSISSNIKDNEALETVTYNYSICKKNEEQLLSLQKWIIETKKQIEEENNKKSSFFSWFNK